MEWVVIGFAFCCGGLIGSIIGDRRKAVVFLRFYGTGQTEFAVGDGTKIVLPLTPVEADSVKAQIEAARCGAK